MLKSQIGVQGTEVDVVSAKQSIGYYELKKHKQWFDEGCSKSLDQRKESKLQWLQEPREINGNK
jgi:Holliday junction resolvase-like predicted endonuclease